MNYKRIIFDMKCDNFLEASKRSISIFNSEGKKIGKLIPVGSWILAESKIINLLVHWRKRAMRMHMSQFKSTYERTFNYLKNFSIREEGRIFFLLYDDSDNLIGHIGVADIDGSYSNQPAGINAELDNTMRGIRGGDPHLIYYAAISMLDWCFKNLGIEKSDLNCLSYNRIAISLYEDIGYKKIENYFLKKYVVNEEILHNLVNESESNIKYQCIKMDLTKKNFYKKSSWLSSI